MIQSVRYSWHATVAVIQLACYSRRDTAGMVHNLVGVPRGTLKVGARVTVTDNDMLCLLQ